MADHVNSENSKQRWLASAINLIDLILIPARALRFAFCWLFIRWRWRAIPIFGAAIGIVLFFETLSSPLFSTVTMSITARTEVLEIETRPGEVLEWELPTGTYGLLTSPDAMACVTHDQFEIECIQEEPTLLRVANAARIRVSVPLPAGEAVVVDPVEPALRLAITPIADANCDKKPSTESGGQATCPDPLISIRGTSGEPIVETIDLVTFESVPISNWRTPISVSHVRVGESLAAGSARQPILIEGGVKLFASIDIGSRVAPRRYLILEETFDAADIVELPASTEQKGLVVGLLAFSRNDELGLVENGILDLTAHTDLDEVLVTRLRAGHSVKLSTWDILARQPVWLAIWGLFVSLILIVGFATGDQANARLGGMLRRRRLQRRPRPKPDHDR